MSGLIDLSERRATQLIETGLASVSSGDLRAARADFEAAAGLYPSAEAFTFWGWMEHHLGDPARAIELCKQAIELDPDFGNPYNDIGSYLVALGRADEAIPWFEKAIGAARYEPRQFPHLNLGRLYLSRRELGKALEHFQAALEFVPDDPEVRRTVVALRTMRSRLH